MVYPTTLWTDGDNDDGVTQVNAAYMNERDVEIEAIEAALGKDLVPSGKTLVSRVQVSTGNDLRLAASGGNVGIRLGAHPPSTKLDVADDVSGAAPTILRLRTATSLNTALLSSLDLGYNLSNSYAYIQGNTSDQAGDLAINPNGGTVGIGTATPGGKGLHLRVAGGATGGPINDDTALVVERSGGTLIHQYLADADETIALWFGRPGDGLRSPDSNPGALTYDYQQDAMRFVVNNVERMRIGSDGDVGIGTSGAKFPLHVNGRLAYGVPNDEPEDADLASGQVSAYLDEINNELIFRVKYSNGTTIRNGVVSLPDPTT